MKSCWLLAGRAQPSSHTAVPSSAGGTSRVFDAVLLFCSVEHFMVGMKAKLPRSLEKTTEVSCLGADLGANGLV